MALLARNGILTARDLLALNPRELLGLPGLGRGALRELETALSRQGVQLAKDPYAKYECARHGEATWDTALSSLLLCDDCATTWQEEAFGGKEPEWVSSPVGGYCLNCNIEREDVAFRQWLLCATCERVARSIGRSVVAERFIMDQWNEVIAPVAPDLELISTDVPRLLRRDPETQRAKRVEPDFVASSRSSGERALAFELKTGKSYIAGATAAGARMGQFQLDTSDCDDIVEVMRRERLPVYLLHVQVIDRAQPPTVRYVALAAWWTDVFSVAEHFQRVQRRPRETRAAAYFDIRMFRGFPALAEHLDAGEHTRIAARLGKEGIPKLYRVE